MPGGAGTLRDLFHDVTGEHAPTPRQIEAARRRLRGVFAARPRRRYFSPNVIRVIGAVAVVALVTATIIGLTWKRTPVDATLTEYARTTRDLAPQELPPGSYVYVHTEETASGGVSDYIGDEYVDIIYMLSTIRDAWWQDDTEVVHTTYGEPTFFDSASEETYYRLGLDRSDQVGETVEQNLGDISGQPVLADWSTDPATLLDQLNEAAARDHGTDPREVKILSMSAQLLAPRLNPPPALRAAVLDVLARLSLESAPTAEGGVSVAVTYDAYFGSTMLRITFDDAGYVVAREETLLDGSTDYNIPPGTVIDHMTQSRPMMTATPGVVPGG
jgi:hypothetical protein